MIGHAFLSTNFNTVQSILQLMVLEFIDATVKTYSQNQHSNVCPHVDNKGTGNEVTLAVHLIVGFDWLFGLLNLQIA